LGGRKFNFLKSSQQKLTGGGEEKVVRPVSDRLVDRGKKLFDDVWVCLFYEVHRPRIPLQGKKKQKKETGRGDLSQQGAGVQPGEREEQAESRSRME